MKASVHMWVAAGIVWAGAVSTARSGDGVIDLTRLSNYASQSVPAYITRDNTTTGNTISDLGATLGRVLFYDKRLSRNDTISCASCHQQAHAFSDTATASTGVGGTTGRHSMRLINSRFAAETRFFWDERAATLEAQTTQPIRDHGEMGFSGTGEDPPFSSLLTKLAATSEYPLLFRHVYGDTEITEDRIQKAIAQFVRSIQSFDSRFDAGRVQVANVNNAFPNFTAQENAGKQLFLAAPPNGAGCAGCHRPGEFDIDPASRNNGVITKIGGGTDLTNTRSPSLRDLVGPGGSSNGAFMHDGSLATLAAVIDHYNVIPGDNTNLDNRLRRPGGATQNLNLTQQQKNDLVAFLRTLTGSAVYTDTRWSDPFAANGSLSLIVFPPEEIRMEWAGGTVTFSCRAVPGQSYQLQASNDLSSWTTLNTVTAGASGQFSYGFAAAGRRFFRFVYVVNPN